MAISVKEIREKEFTRSKHGYDMNEVDDFLDEIAEQLTAVIEENLHLAAQLENQPEPAPAVPAQEPIEAPAYNENSYFKNLESTLRETLISGQRIADETVSKAQREAEEIIAGANAKAKEIASEAEDKIAASTAAAEQIVADAEKKLEELKSATEIYKAQIKAMIEAQQKLIAE